MTPDRSGTALDVQVLSLNGSAPHWEHVDALVTGGPSGKHLPRMSRGR